MESGGYFSRFLPVRKQAPPNSYFSDPAAIFASALSIWEACKKLETSSKHLNLSERYAGMDQLMREAMRVASQFEAWACLHVEFDMLDYAWPYLLKDRFGEACLGAILPNTLVEFDTDDCLRVALKLRLPIRIDDKLPLPIDVKIPNPLPGSAFKEYRIQTMRDSVETEMTTPFTQDDEPFDADFEAPYFSLYGVGEDGLLEHIANRKTYSEAVSLAQKLVPGVEFPSTPNFVNSMTPL